MNIRFYKAMDLAIKNGEQELVVRILPPIGGKEAEIERVLYHKQSSCQPLFAMRFLV